MRLAFLHLLLCASCFLAFGHQGREVSPGLQPGDQVRLRPDQSNPGPSQPVSHDLTVDDAGRLSVPGFGLSFDVRGLRANTVAELVQSGIRDASGLPGLRVSVLSSRDGLPLPEQQCVTVGGEVHEPGPLPFRWDTTLAKAVQAAGGATASGATERIKLYRGGDVFTYDLGNPKEASLTLQRSDIVEVPTRPWASR